MSKLIPLLLITAFLYWMVSAPPAYAYIDPGSGSMMFQIIIAFVMGALFTVKLWFARVKAFFMNLFKKKNNVEQ